MCSDCSKSSKSPTHSNSVEKSWPSLSGSKACQTEQPLPSSSLICLNHGLSSTAGFLYISFLVIYSTMQSFLTCFRPLSSSISLSSSLSAPRCNQINGMSLEPYCIIMANIAALARSGARKNTTMSGIMPSSISRRITRPKIVRPASLGCTGTSLHPRSSRS